MRAIRNASGDLDKNTLSKRARTHTLTHLHTTHSLSLTHTGVQFDDGRFFGKADVQDRNEAAQTLFQAADTDSSGTIEFAEFVAMPVNQGKTKEELRALFDSFDLDGNGTLDLQEFHKYMSREQHPAKKLEHVSSTVLGKGGK